MNGIILVDKPQEWTSHDVIAKLRGVLHERRIGHSGTLDPMATGLLVVFVGRATRAVEFAESDVKKYIASLRLGLVTDTQDITGNIVSESACSVSKEQLEKVLSRFTGKIEQLPPMYSAIKIGGKKLYELARRGEEIERKPREITIHSLEITGRDKDDWILSVKCSKGTYIRTLCHDIGQALGCGGTMSALRRVSAGEFKIEDAHTLDEISSSDSQEDFIIPVDMLFAQYAKITVDAAMEKKCRNGSDFKLQCPDGGCRVYSAGGEFLSIAEAKAGTVKNIKSFFEV